MSRSARGGADREAASVAIVPPLVRSAIARPAAAVDRERGADEPETIEPGATLVLEKVRLWFLGEPAMVDGVVRRLAIECEEPLVESWERIVRSVFADESRVRLRRLTGGFTASTFAAETLDRDGRRTLPTVLKISTRAIADREEAACDRHRPGRPAPRVPGARSRPAEFLLVPASSLGRARGARRALGRVDHARRPEPEQHPLR